MDDASLDDFLDADESEAADDDVTDADQSPDAEADVAHSETDTDTAHSGDTDSDQPTDPSSPQVEPAPVDPATVTSRWHGEGVVCASCGDRVERAWASPNGVVCPSCKEWS
jgi:hypothetical protein